jgi:peptidoglycan/xylan/chitin deacetylase (PgdA/CDA1 family)
MKKRCRRIAALILVLATALTALLSAPAGAETLQDCHKVTSNYKDTKGKQKQVVRLWHVETALDEVTREINGIAEGWAEELGSDLPAAKNTGDGNSRLDVEIRYSRTGLTWMSFMVQARTIFHRELKDQRIATRTYDMTTGMRITLDMIFDEESEAWDLLADRVRTTLTSYWPDVEPDAEALERLCTPEALANADFTLHGMSLVLHYPASLLYEGRQTLMEVPVYYPEIRDMMTERAWTETDNLTYYHTVALTFDDGPKNPRSALVMDALMEKGIRATFFCIGNLVKKAYWVVQREQDNGHAVASHNWTHDNVNSLSGTTLKAMPEKVNKVMIETIGIPVRYDRAPGGLYPKMQKAKVEWPFIQWSLDTYDWRGRSPSAVLSSVKKKIQDGDIILCHDIKENAPKSTRKIVDYLEEQGYMFLTIDELFAKDGVVLENGQVYFRCQDGVTTKKPGGT